MDIFEPALYLTYQVMNEYWFQRRIELLNLPPNKANVDEFSWEILDFEH